MVSYWKNSDQNSPSEKINCYILLIKISAHLVTDSARCNLTPWLMGILSTNEKSP